MRKMLLFSSLVVMLLNSGCSRQLTIQNESREYQPTTTPTLQSQPVQPTPPPATTGQTHNLRTVRGDNITIIERSNGFIFPQFPGKIVILQFFGKECPHCFEEMPIINNLRRKYGNRVQVIAVQVQEPMGAATAHHLIERFHMNYPVVDRDEAIDLLMFVKRTYAWMGAVPFTLIVKDGVTEHTFRGGQEESEIENGIREVL